MQDNNNSQDLNNQAEQESAGVQQTQPSVQNTPAKIDGQQQAQNAQSTDNAQEIADKGQSNPTSQGGQDNQDQLQVDPNKPTILLVEDDPLLIKMYKAKFESDGLNLLTAEDGEEGLQTATTQKPNFIILDVMMPKMSGIDLLAKLKENASTKDIGVIVLSNLSQEKESKRALELGAKEYILKASLTPSQLIQKVKQYMGQ